MFSYDADAKEIHLFDQIGPAWAGMVGMEQMSEALAAMGGKDFTLYLSTPGGSVDEGTAMFNAIERYSGNVTIVVDSLAASMGSYLLQAADTRVVASNSKLMIHNPWTIAYGDGDTLRKEADVLDKYREAMVPAYSERSGKTSDAVRAIMADETWYVGQEIVDAGFADKMTGKAKAAIDMIKLAFWAKKIPEAVKEEVRTMAQQRRSMTLAEARALRDRVAKV